MVKSLGIHVYGRVQGVFFRYAAKMEAEKLNITGFAENREDGSVYIEAEGDEDALHKFIEWCRRGPPLALVEKVDVILRSKPSSPVKFEIR